MKIFLLTLVTLFSIQQTSACSMYKITLDGKTMVGCNEDAWRTTPHIWFENANTKWKFGATFTGSRFDGPNGYAPQSGMNEMGLTYSRLASHTPENSTDMSNKKRITNPTNYLKDILHQCATIEEVEAFIGEYDHSYFLEDVMIYIEPSGRYLVVEPYLMTRGNDANYVLSNFCPSATEESAALNIDRYRKGVEFLKNGADLNLNFCRTLSDTMSVCREKIGDGTLLTSIWDTQNGEVNLYFYHQYKDAIHYNLQEELKKGDHIIALAGLFPANADFEKLSRYRIPQNTMGLMLLLMCSGVLFLFSAIYFLIHCMRKRKSESYSTLQLFLFPLGICMFIYMFILCTNMYIFYFPSPYIDPNDALLSASSYLPYLIVILIGPLILFNRKILLQKMWGGFSRWLFTLNTVVYFILLGLFVYWGFLF